MPMPMPMPMPVPTGFPIFPRHARSRASRDATMENETGGTFWPRCLSQGCILEALAASGGRDHRGRHLRLVDHQTNTQDRETSHNMSTIILPRKKLEN
ncbi:hypothetical protein LIA77_10155 [Sarocladium implicatum]|nr:hypothetical protein LIA77_10155 [Sarocladium implicatum]